jgi:hypothetical protein
LIREELVLLLESHEGAPARLCADALRRNAPFEVWDAVTDRQEVASIYSRRERHSRRTQQPSIGFASAVRALKDYTGVGLRIGYVNDRVGDGFYFQLFLDAEATRVVACLGVRPSPRNGIVGGD